MDYTDFSDIAPFNDEEAAAALARVSIHPNVPWISKFLFPDKPNTFLGDVLRNIHTVDEFQQIVMSKAIQWVIGNTITEFTYDGAYLRGSDRVLIATDSSKKYLDKNATKLEEKW